LGFGNYPNGLQIDGSESTLFINMGVNYGGDHGDTLSALNILKFNASASIAQQTPSPVALLSCKALSPRLCQTDTGFKLDRSSNKLCVLRNTNWGSPNTWIDFTTIDVLSGAQNTIKINATSSPRALLFWYSYMEMAFY
jgi:hypothetical protein